MSSAPGMKILPVIAVIMFISGACTGTSASESREAAVYEEIVRWVIDDRSPADDGEPLRIFIDALAAEEIPLEVQVEIIDRFGDAVDMRFIDDQAEAVEDEDLLPVRDGGILIGLGEVPTTEPVVVRVEVYRSRTDNLAFVVELDGSGDSWRVVGEPEPIPVEELVDDE